MPDIYVILAEIGIVLALITGAFFEGEHIQRTADQVAADQLKIAAAAELATANDAAAAADLAHAKRNTELEAQNAAHQQELDAKNRSLADLAARLDRVRAAGGRGAGGGCQMPGAASPAPQRSGPAAADGGPAPGSFSELAAIAADAVTLARRGEDCHAYVVPDVGGGQ